MLAISPLQTRAGRGVAVLLVLTMFAGVATLRQQPAEPTVKASTSVVMVEVRDTGFDLAHYIAADRPYGLHARVTATSDPHWRRLEVSMDQTAAEALAWRLSTYPPIVDARVAR
jgi:hypothetical protein